MEYSLCQKLWPEQSLKVVQYLLKIKSLPLVGEIIFPIPYLSWWFSPYFQHLGNQKCALFFFFSKKIDIIFLHIIFLFQKLALWFPKLLLSRSSRVRLWATPETTRLPGPDTKQVVLAKNSHTAVWFYSIWCNGAIYRRDCAFSSVCLKIQQCI